MTIIFKRQTAESAVMRLTKETAKDRIEVVAVPVGNNIEKTVHKTFLEFQTLSAENLICHICKFRRF